MAIYPYPSMGLVGRRRGQPKAQVSQKKYTTISWITIHLNESLATRLSELEWTGRVVDCCTTIHGKSVAVSHVRSISRKNDMGRGECVNIW